MEDNPSTNNIDYVDIEVENDAINETAPLMASGKYEGQSKPLSGDIHCWKNAPPTAHIIYNELSWERFKIFLLLIAMIVAAVVFSLKQEEEDHRINLAAVSQADPLIVPAKKSDSRDVLEVLVSAQSTGESIFPDETNVTVTVEAKKTKDSGWIDIDSHDFETDDDHEIINEEHDFFIEDDENEAYRFVISTNSAQPVGITFHYRDIFTIVKYQVILAAICLIFVYILIVFELMHRTVAAMIGSFVALGVLSIVHARPTFDTVISWIDFETVGLLFGMMIMVGIFSETGFFEWSAVKAYKLSKGNLWHLTVILCIFTAVVSAFLDNVTTILLLTPVTVRLCKVLDVKPEPILIAEVMFSNLGGTATPIGDPPNIIIVNDPRVSAHPSVNFGSFTLHVGPGVVIAIVVCFFLIYFLFKRAQGDKREPHLAKQKELEIWQKSLSKINPNGSEEEKKVAEYLNNYINELQNEIAQSPDSNEVKAVDITELEAKYTIRNKPLFISSCCVLTGVIIMFFLHSWIEDQVELSLAWIAIIGAMIHLVVSGIHDVEEVLEKVELGTLLFFAALFVLMKGLEELGLIDFIGDQIASIIEKVPEGDGRLAVAIIIILWVSAIVSAFIDNIPYTTAMVPVVVNLAEGGLGLPLAPLVWTLSYGTCFGGNGTLIGASANVVAVGLAEQDGYPISFNTFFKTGFPTMILSVFVAMCYLLVSHVLIHWWSID